MKRRLLLRKAGVLLAVTMINTAYPATVVTTIRSSKDNTLIQTADGSKSNGKNIINVGTTGQATGINIRRGLVAFDLSSVPASTIIDSAKLVMSYSTGTASTDISLEVHKMDADWGEGTSSSTGGVGANSSTNNATWLHTFYNTALWATPGGDFDSNAASIQSVLSTDVSATFRGRELTKNVQDWITNPTSNYGWLLKSTNETLASIVVKFNSRETAYAEDLKPTLFVYYQSLATEIGSLPAINTNSIQPILAGSTLIVSSAGRLHSVEIFNLSGKPVLKSMENTVEVGYLPSGVYFVKVSTAKETVTRKIIKL
ncbi:MAG: DNRLRE domain-containing protein [Paludibacter sp.]